MPRLTNTSSGSPLKSLAFGLLCILAPAGYGGEMARAGSASPPPPVPVPFAVVDGVALVAPANTIPDRLTGMLRGLFEFPAGGPRSAIVMSGGGPVPLRLNGWYGAKTAAGNYGDLYDNRDGGHSSIPKDVFPQLARVVYGEEARKTGLDRGLNGSLLFNAVTIGNASLAFTEGPFWRSLPRDALTNPQQVAHLYQEYSSNQLYVYPEHQDHDPTLGDVIPANTPYFLISQGSSGSDQPILQALVATLAAFRPEVKTFLIQRQLIAPTLQWLFRISQNGIATDAGYLSGKAHPSVFDGQAINLPALIERAHDLQAADVPPMVQLRVLEESRATAGIDTFFPQAADALFDTPSAIARVIRSTALDKRIVIDAGETLDPNARPLTFRWVVMSGKATIRTLNDRGSTAEIVVPWQERHHSVWEPNLATDRVDIGVFADNGKHLSAPAFVSFEFPGNEKRTYRDDGQIAEVDYAPAELHGRYVDPLIFPSRDWRDTYVYDSAGHLSGWTRFRGDAVTHFYRDGTKVIETDSAGRSLRGEKVEYVTEQIPDVGIRVTEKPTGQFVAYERAKVAP